MRNANRLLENLGLSEGRKLRVYHGTTEKKVKSIQRSGLTGGYDSASWFMVATDFESALFHASPESDEKAIVIELEVPVEGEPWEGHPYFWPAEKFNAKREWYALMQAIPKKFIKEIHRVPFDQWMEQKSAGF